jgi:hypothetical protein
MANKGYWVMYATHDRRGSTFNRKGQMSAKKNKEGKEGKNKNVK